MKINEEYVFGLSEDTLKKIKTGGASKANKLAHDLNVENASVSNLLMNHYFLKRGQVKEPFTTEDQITFVDAISGKVTFSFLVEYALGCSDSSYVDEDQMSFNFVIDKETQTVILEEITFPKREADEI